MAPIPKALREQNERAEQIHKAHYGQDTDTAPTEAPDDRQQDTDGGQEQPPQAQAPNEPDAPAAEAEPDGQDGDGEGHGQESIESQFKRLKIAHETLQGKYRAEVPRVQEQNRNLTEQVDRLTRELSAAKSEAKAAPEASDGSLKERLRQLEDEFGEEFSKTIHTIAENVADARLNDYSEKRNQDDGEKFMASVRRNIAQFDSINTDPQFVQWLRDTNDPQTGFNYQSTLNTAGQELDLNAVIRVFTDFQRAQEPPAPPPVDPRSPEAQVAPSAGQRGAPPPEQPSYTVDDMQQLQRDIQRGRYKGREAEARALEREIHAALVS